MNFSCCRPPRPLMGLLSLSVAFPFARLRKCSVREERAGGSITGVPPPPPPIFPYGSIRMCEGSGTLAQLCCSPHLARRARQCPPSSTSSQVVGIRSVVYEALRASRVVNRSLHHLPRSLDSFRVYRPPLSLSLPPRLDHAWRTPLPALIRAGASGGPVVPSRVAIKAPSVTD